MKEITSIASIGKVIESSWGRETSYEPLKWTPENPAWGQCAVTALVVQDYFGGELVRASEGEMSHFWNLIDGDQIDFTVKQFEEPPIWNDPPESVNRDYVLLSSDTRQRYYVLRQRVREALAQEVA